MLFRAGRWRMHGNVLHIQYRYVHVYKFQIICSDQLFYLFLLGRVTFPDEGLHRIKIKSLVHYREPP